MTVVYAPASQQLAHFHADNGCIVRFVEIIVQCMMQVSIK